MEIALFIGILAAVALVAPPVLNSRRRSSRTMAHIASVCERQRRSGLV